MTRQGLARWCYRRAHPVTWLRWLRVSALAVVVITALLGWLETSRAHAGITVASTHGVRAVADVADASQQLGAANSAVQGSFTVGAVALTGPGATYTADIASAAQDLVLAAEDNVAGPAGSAQVQFTEGQLSTYRALVDQAGTDFAAGDPVLARAELGSATTFLNGLTGKSGDLQQLGQGELNAVNAALGSAWLTPGTLWLLLLVPLALLAAVAAWTCYVLLAGFRRVLSAPLMLAVVASLAFVITVATANAHDSAHAMRFVQLAVSELPGHPSQLAALSPDAAIGSSGAIVLAAAALAACAALLAFAAYRPRILEYRLS